MRLDEVTMTGTTDVVFRRNRSVLAWNVWRGICSVCGYSGEVEKKRTCGLHRKFFEKQVNSPRANLCFAQYRHGAFGCLQKATIFLFFNEQRGSSATVLRCWHPKLQEKQSSSFLRNMADILDTIVEAKRFGDWASPRYFPEPASWQNEIFMQHSNNHLLHGFPYITVEIKPASPVTGALLPPRANSADIANAYENGGFLLFCVGGWMFLRIIRQYSLCKTANTTTHLPFSAKNLFSSENKSNEHACSVRIVFSIVLHSFSRRALSSALSRSLAWHHWSKFQMKQIFIKALATDCKIGIKIVIFLIFPSISGRTLIWHAAFQKVEEYWVFQDFPGQMSVLCVPWWMAYWKSSHPFCTRGCGTRFFWSTETEDPNSRESSAHKILWSTFRRGISKWRNDYSLWDWTLSVFKRFSFIIGEKTATLPEKMRFVGVSKINRPMESTAHTAIFPLISHNFRGMNPQKIFTIFPFLFSKGISVGENLPLSEEMAQWKTFMELFILMALILVRENFCGICPKRAKPF